MTTKRESVQVRLSNGGVAFYAKCDVCGQQEHPAKPHPAIGDRLYNRGDMANPEHWGTVVGYRSRHVEIRPDAVTGYDGSQLYNGTETYCVPAVMVHHEDKGNGLTRIVTKAAYDKFRQERIQEGWRAMRKALDQAGLK